MTNEEIKKIEDAIKGISYDNINNGKFGTEVHIEWGDWKHDHARLDYLMANIGYMKTNEEVTDEDGSDCYSATHYYEQVA